MSVTVRGKIVLLMPFIFMLQKVNCNIVLRTNIDWNLGTKMWGLYAPKVKKIMKDVLQPFISIIISISWFYLTKTSIRTLGICLDRELLVKIYLFTSSLQFSTNLLIFSIIFLSHIHHITKSATVKISQKFTIQTEPLTKDVAVLSILFC